MAEYILVSGTVRDLQIAKGHESLFPQEFNKNLLGLATIVVAASDRPTSVGDADIDMEFFTCSVGDIRVTGRFHRVGFTDDDTIDFVVTMEDGLAEAHCARDPVRRLMWTLPYKTRGHIAQKKHNIASSLTISMVSAVLFSLLILFHSAEPLSECWGRLRVDALIAFFSVLPVCFLSRWPFYKFSIEATAIFAVLGFKNSEYLDLPKFHGRADKSYYHEINQPRPWYMPPLTYRYVLTADVA